MQKTPPPGLFLVVDGLDGAGKSTLIKGLAHHLSRREVVLSREPTHGPYGRQLRESGAAGRLTPEREIELFELDRAEHVRDVIAPALARGAIVILDRYYYSSVAYQAAFGPPEAILARFTSFAPKPDLALILDLPVAVALSRIQQRGEGRTDFERTETLEQCRQRFAWVIAHCPESRRLDADRPADTMLTEALGHVALTAVDGTRRRHADPARQAVEVAWLLARD